MTNKKEYKAKLRRKVLRYFKKVDYSIKKKSFNGLGQISKDKIRELHSQQRKQKISKEQKFIKSFKDEMLKYLASGEKVSPEKINPYIIEVKPGTLHSKIFRFAKLNWSVPVSEGYGRRMRFLVMDAYNDKLIGIFALGDPVYNLKVRDNWIGWTQKTKSKNLVNVLDAYILGAIPPYSNLIGGKLVAALVTSKEVQKLFNKKYGTAKSVIKKRRIHPKLVLITTSSALGKSSIYDRLKLNGDLLFQKIGETQGYGHFHISDNLFEELRIYLKLIKHPYAMGFKFGQGANWRFRVIRKAFSELGLSPDFLSHGIRREVYIVPLAKNVQNYLNGKSKRAFLKLKTVKEISELCKERWIIPRSQRDKSYLNINNAETLQRMINLG